MSAFRKTHVPHGCCIPAPIWIYCLFAFPSAETGINLHLRLWFKLFDKGVSPSCRNLSIEKWDWDTKGMWPKSLGWNVSGLNPGNVRCHSHPCVSLYFLEIFPRWIYCHDLYDHREKKGMKFQGDLTHGTTMPIQIIKNSKQGSNTLSMEITLPFLLAVSFLVIDRI